MAVYCLLELYDEKYGLALENGDITINIGSKVGCLAGVMGSLSTMIDDNSRNVVIEAAIFDGVRIRKTSNRLNLVKSKNPVIIEKKLMKQRKNIDKLISNAKILLKS